MSDGVAIKRRGGKRAKKKGRAGVGLAHLLDGGDDDHGLVLWPSAAFKKKCGGGGSGSGGGGGGGGAAAAAAGAAGAAAAGTNVDDGVVHGVDSGAGVAPKGGKKRRRRKKAVTLSDDEGDAPVAPTAPDYSAEAIAALKAATLRRPAQVRAAAAEAVAAAQADAGSGVGDAAPQPPAAAADDDNAKLSDDGGDDDDDFMARMNAAVSKAKALRKAKREGVEVDAGGSGSGGAGVAAPDFLSLTPGKGAAGRPPRGASALERMVAEDDDTPTPVPRGPSAPIPPAAARRAAATGLSGKGGGWSTRASSHDPTRRLHGGSDDAPVTLDQIRARLSSQLAASREAADRDARDVNRLRVEADAARERRDKYKDRLDALAAEYDFFQDMRRWVSNLCGFLTAKTAAVAELEAQQAAAYLEASTDVAARRGADVLDDVAAAGGAAHVVGTLPDAPVEEHGADGAERVAGMVPPAAVRAARRQARRQSAGGGAGVTLDTLSDTDASDTDAARRDAARSSAAGAAAELFADARREFASLGAVLPRFVRWRDDFGQTYADAYVAHSLPDVASVYVRRHLLSWEPHLAATDLAAMPWYTELRAYVGATPRGLDVDLLPKVVHKVVLPRLIAAVVDGWDPVSTRQTTAVVSATRQVLQPAHAVPPAAVAPLAAAVVGRLQLVAAELCVPFVASPGPQLPPVTTRALCTCLKVVRSAASWEGVVNDSALRSVVVDHVWQPVVVAALRHLPPEHQPHWHAVAQSAAPPRWHLTV